MAQTAEDPHLINSKRETTREIGAAILWQIAVCFGVLWAYGVLIRVLGTPVGVRSDVPPMWAWWGYPQFYYHHVRVLMLVPPGLLAAAWLNVARRAIHGAAFVTIAIIFAFTFDIAVCMISSDFGPKGGFYEIVRPFDFPGIEFYGDVGLVQSTGQFLHDFVELRQQHMLSLHSTTHPPGPVLFFHYVRWWVGPGLMRAALLAIALSALALLPAFLLTRRVYGPVTAKIAVCVLAVTPSLVLHGATSMDAVYVLPMVTCIWLYVEAIQAGSVVSSLSIATCLGLVMAVCAMLTFATCCLGMLMGIHAILLACRKQKNWRPWPVLVSAGIVFLTVFWLIRFRTGYDLLTVARNSMESDNSLMGRRGGGSVARYFDFAGANLVAFLIGCGAALTVTLVSRLSQVIRGGRQALSTDPFLMALAITISIMATSMLFRLETERVWLFMMPLVACVAAPWIQCRNTGKLLTCVVAAQAIQTILMQTFLFMLW